MASEHALKIESITSIEEISEELGGIEKKYGDFKEPIRSDEFPVKKRIDMRYSRKSKRSSGIAKKPDEEEEKRGIKQAFLRFFGSLPIPTFIKRKPKTMMESQSTPSGNVSEMFKTRALKGKDKSIERPPSRIEYETSMDHIKTVSYPSILPRVIKSPQETVLISYHPKKLRLRLDRRRSLLSLPHKGEMRDGVVIDYMDYDRFKQIAIIPTIISASLKGHYSLKSKKIRIDDIKTKFQKIYAKIAMMIVLDASMSMRPEIPKIMNLLEALKLMAWRKRDKIGVIVCAGDDAYILAYPTTNINVLRRKFSQIRTGGRTALATGMLMALRILHLERIKNPDVIPIILVISDGLANAPLRIKIPEKFYEICPIKGFADALYVAYLIRRKKVPLIALNPFHELREKPVYNWTPTKLMQAIANITNGIYIGIPRILKPSVEQIAKTILMALSKIIEKTSII